MPQDHHQKHHLYHQSDNLPEVDRSILHQLFDHVHQYGDYRDMVQFHISRATRI